MADGTTRRAHQKAAVAGKDFGPQAIGRSRGGTGGAAPRPWAESLRGDAGSGNFGRAPDGHVVEGRRGVLSRVSRSGMWNPRVISSVVERFVHIEDVRSSNLLSPTKFDGEPGLSRFPFAPPSAPDRVGAEEGTKREDCANLD